MNARRTTWLAWSLGLLSGSGWATIAGVAPDPSRATGFGALLRFQIGPMGAAPLGWALLVAAALPLAIGQSSNAFSRDCRRSSLSNSPFCGW